MNIYYPCKPTYEETKQLVPKIPKTPDYSVGGIKIKLLHDISRYQNAPNRDYRMAVAQSTLEDLYKELFG